MKKLILLCLVLLTTCVTPPCYHNNYLNITDYQVHVDSITPHGIKVDSSGEEVDLREIDRQVDALEECLETSIQRTCLRIKVAPDWYISECSGQQLFPCDINDQVCLDKGLTEEDLEICPCNCRATIQDENTIIVTPDLRLLRGELARMITGINNPWIPEISPCLMDRKAQDEEDISNSFVSPSFMF